MPGGAAPEAGEPAATVATPGAPMISRGIQNLRMITAWRRGQTGVAATAERLAINLEAASEGRFRVRITAAGEPGPTDRLPAVLRRGEAELIHTGFDLFRQEHPAHTWFDAVPFGLDGPEADAWLSHGGGRELADELGEAVGLYYLPCGNAGAGGGGWFREAPASDADAATLRLRAAGLAADVARQAGATVADLTLARARGALSAGSLDGAFGDGPWADLEAGLDRVAGAWLYPDWLRPSGPLWLGVGRGLHNSLTDSDRRLFAAVAAEQHAATAAAFTAGNARAAAEIRRREGLSVAPLPAPLTAAFSTATEEVLATVSIADPLSRRVFESWRVFRARVAGWSGTATAPFLTGREAAPGEN